MRLYIKYNSTKIAVLIKFKNSIYRCMHKEMLFTEKQSSIRCAVENKKTLKNRNLVDNITCKIYTNMSKLREIK